mmetsp:Transcript_34233/g.90236  ORF Transcript_34233/g.90236 Transcript_34233/m.90236 type:complete len:139 (+) Transcript_34233:798-1214(+)
MAPLEEVLTPDVIQGSGVQFLDTDYLRTVVVVINKAAEPEWLNVYQGIGTDIAGYGGPDWASGGGCGQNDGNFGAEIDRQRETGSPVVPGSATCVAPLTRRFAQPSAAFRLARISSHHLPCIAGLSPKGSMCYTRLLS